MATPATTREKEHQNAAEVMAHHGLAILQVLVLHTSLLAKLWLPHPGHVQSPGLTVMEGQRVLLQTSRDLKLWFPHSGQNQSPRRNS